MIMQSHSKLYTHTCLARSNPEMVRTAGCSALVRAGLEQKEHPEVVRPAGLGGRVISGALYSLPHAMHSLFMRKVLLITFIRSHRLNTSSLMKEVLWAIN